MNDKGEVPAVLWILGALFVLMILVSLSSPPTGEIHGTEGVPQTNMLGAEK
jgi:hypothetical protein